MKLYCHVLLVIVYTFGVRCQNNQTSRDIYLLTMIPYPNPVPQLNPTWDDGDNIRPALELAKDQINSNGSLLENYTLHLIHGDGGCQIVSTTTFNFVQKAYYHENGSRVTGIIGPGCSISSGYLGNLTNETELSLVNVHGAGNPMLADRTQYPYLLGKLGSTEKFVQAFHCLKEGAKWGKVAVLFDDFRLFYLRTKTLLVAKVNATFQSSVSSTFIPLLQIREQRLRVIFVLCPLKLTRQIMCLAYHEGMFYENYQWVIMSKLLNELVEKHFTFQYDGRTYDCSPKKMTTALEKALLLSYRLEHENDFDYRISNMTYAEFKKEYERYRVDYNLKPRRFETQENSTFTHWAAFLYDAVWAWALVLNNLTKSGQRFEVGSDYGNVSQAKMIVEQFYQTKFKGMSGDIAFNSTTGFVDRIVDIVQVESNRSKPVSSVMASGTHACTMFTAIPDTFPVNLRESKSWGIFYVILIALQLIIIVLLQVLTFLFSSEPSIKAASPRLLHISYIGAYVVATGTFVWTLSIAVDLDPNLRPFFCQFMWAWCLPVGFILLFVPVAMRTWRVYRIFKHYMNPGPLISDPALIGGVLLALLGILVIAITWTVVDSFHLDDLIDISRDNGTIVVHRKYECGCNFYFFWFASILIYVASMVFIVTVFALLTRHIPNKSFTTKSLRVLCYTVTLLFFTGFPIYCFLSFAIFDPIYKFATISLLVNLMLAAFCVCIFVPPLWPIFKNHSKDSRVKKDTVSLMRKISQSSMQSNQSNKS